MSGTALLEWAGRLLRAACISYHAHLDYPVVDGPNPPTLTKNNFRNFAEEPVNWGTTFSSSGRSPFPSSHLSMTSSPIDRAVPRTGRIAD
jgi:hypothetical protein